MKTLSFKKQLFLHLDGIVIIPILSTLNRLGILEYIIKKKHFTLDELNNNFNINKAYCNVLLRSLLSSGFLYVFLDAVTGLCHKYIYCDSITSPIVFLSTIVGGGLVYIYSLYITGAYTLGELKELS